MSDREKIRRSICHFVMRKAWNIFKSVKVICFSQALKIAWKLIRGKLYPIKSKVRGVSYGDCQKVIRCLSKLNKDYYRITLEIKKNILV
ncbi:hypothetical protein [Vallitalea guaymasensis]|uniref:hypothetical protein n=1 Tax=Vallitalea guaymasensis TaxID=1185412 RepID=UPI000DE4C03F|nr:hypothetical protein [Vallitalea guaymasensis]